MIFLPLVLFGGLSLFVYDAEALDGWYAQRYTNALCTTQVHPNVAPGCTYDYPEGPAGGK